MFSWLFACLLPTLAQCACNRRCRFEDARARCAPQVTAAAVKQRRRRRGSNGSKGGTASGMRRGIPSWVHMPALGESYQPHRWMGSGHHITPSRGPLPLQVHAAQGSRF